MSLPSSRRLVAELPDPDGHLEIAARQLSDPRVAPWHGGSQTREQVREMLVRQADQAAETGFCLWWWRERASGELVGWTGLNRDQVEGSPVVEAGWSITPERWGEGLASEAGRAALEWGFGRAGLRRIVSFALVDNAASIRVMKRIGMQREREFERRGLPHLLCAIRHQQFDRPMALRPRRRRR